MKQIKIESNGVEQLITVPENSKVTIDGNVVVFEPKFKKGDCVIGKGYFHPKKAKYVEFVKDECVCRYDNNSNYCDFKYLRLATIEEENETLSDLKAEGKQWNADKLCIEDSKVVPKVGDCCRIDFIGEGSGVHDYLVYGGTEGAHKSKGNVFSTKDGITEYMSYSNDVEFTVIPKDQFQSELAQLGFEYNFENDTISELKWKPKEDDICYLLIKNYDTFGYSKIKYAKALGAALRTGHLYKTPELCQQAIDKIKQILSEK